MREAAFEQVTSALEAIRESLMPLTVDLLELPHVLVGEALSIVRPMLPSAPHHAPPSRPTTLFGTDDPVRLGAISPDGLIVLLGPSWAPEERHRPHEEQR